MNQPNQTEITSSLERILSSTYFRQSRKLAAFLRFVVEKTLRGEAGEIKEYTIGKEILSRKESFNPQQDASVRIHALRLRNVLQLYYSREGQEDLVRIEIPKGQYAATFQYRAAAEADKPLEPVTDSYTRSVTATRPLVAVLPFTCYADQGCDPHLSDQICIQLTASLSRYEDISVISFYSTSHYTNQPDDLRKVRESLRATHILVGSLHQYDHSLIVSFELIHAPDFRILWASCMEHKMEGRPIFEEWSSVAHKVAAELAGYGGAILLKRNDLAMGQQDTLAYFDAVYCFYQFHIRNTEEVFHRTRRLLEEAVDRFPQYAIGHATLAHLLLDGMMYGFVASPDALALAMTHARRAIELDARSQHGHLAMAWGHIIMGNYDGFRRSLEDCLEVNPNAPFFLRCAAFGYTLMADYEKGRHYIEQSRHFTPVHRWWMNMTEGLIALKEGNLDMARTVFDQIDEAGYVYQYIFPSAMLALMGDYPAARHLAATYRERYPGGAQIVAASLSAIMRDRELFEQLLDGFRLAGLLEESAAVPFTQRQTSSLPKLS